MGNYGIQFFTLCRDAMIQARRSKILLILMILCSLILFVFYFGIQVEQGDIVTDEFRVSVPLFGFSTATSPAVFAKGVISFALNLILNIGLFWFIFAFSGYIPQTLAKGSADLLLSKPISRWMILVSKSIVIEILAFLTAAYFFYGMLAGLWIKTGYIAEDVILPFMIIFITFIPLLAIMALLNVLTRSTIATVLITVFYYFVSLGLGGVSKIGFDNEPGWLFTILKWLYYCLPDFLGMSTSLRELVNGGDLAFTPFIHSLIVASVVYSLAIVVLYRKDYTT